MQVSLLSRDLDCKNSTYARNVEFGKITKNQLSKVLNVGEGGIKDRFVCVVSGPSGVGKDSILEGFDKKYKFFSRVVTCTTRKPRPGEIDGVNYHFLSPDEFQRGIENDEFLEYVNVYADRFYGTRKRDVDDALDTGKSVIMALDVDGAAMVKKKRPDTVLLFFEPPSIQELASRLVKRGTETLAAIKERVAKASYELGFKDKYDVVIRNDDLAESIDEMAEVFKVIN